MLERWFSRGKVYFKSSDLEDEGFDGSRKRIAQIVVVYRKYRGRKFDIINDRKCGSVTFKIVPRN